MQRRENLLQPDEPGACELCAVDSAVYNFGMVCCRVRFILGVPVLEIRQGWLERWRRMDSEMGAEVEREVAAQWKSKRKG